MTNPLNVKERDPDASPPLMNGSSPMSHAQKEQKKKDIGEKGVDEEVHGFVTAYSPPLPKVREDSAYAPNGSDPKSWVQRKKKDIGEKGVDEEVHGFVTAYSPPLPKVREEKPYAPNGSDPKSYIEKKKDSQDIANKEIRPDVWQTVHDMVGPTNGYVREANAPPATEDLETAFYDKQNNLWRM